MSSTYAAVSSVMLPKAAQVVDPVHVISLANRCLDAVRRRVQIEQPGHRARPDDPLSRARRVLLKGEETLEEGAKERLWPLLELGDPNAEIASACRVKERLREFCRTADPEALVSSWKSFRRTACRGPCLRSPEKLGRTIRKWFDKICSSHLARVSNGPTQALNNLVKRIKRVAFGFRDFEDCRIRALLYAGRPSWRVLGSIVVRSWRDPARFR